MKGELIVSFRYNKLSRRPLPATIVREYTTFKINEDTCRAYLITHLPDLDITEVVLKKCITIFKLLLKYGDNIDYCENELTVWPESSAWIINRNIRDIFYYMFNNKNISIDVGTVKNNSLYNELNGDESNNNESNILSSCEDEESDFYDLKSILACDKEYNIFLNYWSKGHDVQDLINVVSEVSYSVLNNGNIFPLEITEYILCLARDML
jgi:hypothetical protein